MLLTPTKTLPCGRKIGLSNCIIVERYLHNYRAPLTAAYHVRYHTLQVVIYPCAFPSFEWKTVGGGLMNPI